MTDPAEHAAQRREMFAHAAQLAHLPASLEATVVAMIEVSGMVDLVVDIRADSGLAGAVGAALDAQRPVLCDCEMVREGIAQPDGSPVLSLLNDPRVPPLAKAMGNTRSAAAVDLWGDALAGAVVVVGNAPTALFRLYELLAAGAPRPAAIIGIPVGFVGASESKALLAQGIAGVPYLTVLGRRGGSALASAAFNALAAGARA